MTFRSTHTLRVASCMAQNADSMCRGLTRYLAQSLNMPACFVDGVPWQERERLLDAGEIDLCWICGLPYVEKADRAAGIELCVAPVMKGERYRGLPVYFSDVLVRADSRFTCFADLQGAAWAYNEPRSHSGYNVVRHHLAQSSCAFDYFGRLVEAGSHQAALRLIRAGEVAAAAIDSTVLEAELAQTPALAPEMRRIAVLGPSPAPPWIVSTGLPANLRDDIQACLIDMSAQAAGRRVLDTWQISELRAVDDAAYDPIRTMARSAAWV